MRYGCMVFAIILLLLTGWLQSAEEPKAASDAQASADAQQPKDWAMNATIIEACSCPMFCQCYFDTKPAAQPASKDDAHAGHEGHGAAGEHYCKFNNAYKVNKGSFGETKLDGAKFWLSGDLGHDFSEGKMDWAVLTFDPATTPEQRQGIEAVLKNLLPVKWNSFTVAEPKPIEWKAERDQAIARLDGGKAAEVVLKKNEGMTKDPIVIQNLKYWGAPRNDGFILMQNDVQALRQAPEGQKPFEFKRTNGFMITFDISSKDKR